MIYFLHGEDTVASRIRLSELKSAKNKEVVEIADPKDMVESSLFADSRQFVLWFDKKLSVAQIKDFESKFGKLSVEEFKVSPIVFKFLDSLAPGNQKNFMPLWQAYLRTQPAEVAFVMLVRQFRLLLNLADPDVQPWQKGKLASQAKLFAPSQLKTIYQKLLLVDYQNKTGSGIASLSTALELLLLSI